MPSDLNLSSNDDPFSDALRHLTAQGCDLSRVLWVMPRVEAVGRFKALWWAHWGGQTCLAPRVQTADRLSQTASQGVWLNMHTSLVGLLRNLPNLCGGLSEEQLWALAQEYLELAMRLVLVGQSDQSGWGHYCVSNRFSAQEAQVVAQVADAFEQNLLRCVAQPAVDAAQLDLIVWFDDAEQMPALWFKYCLPHTPVLRVQLPRIEGVKPWQQLADQLQGRVHISVAADETAQAQHAADQVLQWLSADAQTEIAIAVLDRLAARRLVAVLAEHGVLVDDRTGWRLSTSNVAGWFDALLLLHAEQGVLGGLQHPFTGQPLLGFEPWARTGQYTLAQWAVACVDLLQTSGVYPVLQGDEAGFQLCAGLRGMACVQSDTVFNAFGFLAAWRYWAENARFRPLDIESPVRLVPLMSTRLRQFQRVLVLGCAQSHLQESPPGLLPPSVAQELGFPGPRIVRIQKLSALYDLLINTKQVRLVHAAQAGGTHQPLLPELQWLDIVLASGSGAAWFVQPSDACQPIEYTEPEPLYLKAAQGGRWVPTELRVTALDDFVACPLRFGLKHALPWANRRENESASFEQLRGVLVHRVLEKAARCMAAQGESHPSVEAWKQVLFEQGRAAFARLSLKEQSVVHPFMAQFELLVPRIAGSLIKRRTEGKWIFSAAETLLAGAIQLNGLGRCVGLKGRVDRVDARDGAVSITDIKFKSLSVLKKQAADPLSAPQLPIYQRLLANTTGQGVAQLSFLGIHKDNVAWVEFAPVSDEYTAQGFESWGDVLFAHLEQALDSFFSGNQPWEARPGDACTWCDVVGICRPVCAEQALSEEEDA